MKQKIPFGEQFTGGDFWLLVIRHWSGAELSVGHGASLSYIRHLLDVIHHP